jgi:hypothetical protein
MTRQFRVQIKSETVTEYVIPVEDSELIPPSASGEETVEDQIRDIVSSMDQQEFEDCQQEVVHSYWGVELVEEVGEEASNV